jgi:hypothetical protein
MAIPRRVPIGRLDEGMIPSSNTLDGIWRIEVQMRIHDIPLMGFSGWYSSVGSETVKHPQAISLNLRSELVLARSDKMARVTYQLERG